MKHRVLTGCVAGVAAVALGVAPAFAAIEGVYAFAWDDGGLFEYTDVTTGEAERVSTSMPAPRVAGLDVDWTGAGFAVDLSDGITEGVLAHLFSVDIESGEVADLGAVVGDGFEARGCSGLDLTGGVISIACHVGDDYEVSFVGTVDPSTLAFTSIAGATPMPAIQSLATNPVDGVLYGFGYYGQIIRIAGGAWEVVGTTPTSPATGEPVIIRGADFANDGTLWGTVSNPDELALSGVGGWAFTPVDGTLEFDDVTDWSESLTLFDPTPAPVPPAPGPAPGPAIVATGSAPPIAAAIAGIALLVAGGIALGARAATRRRAV